MSDTTKKMYGWDKYGGARKGTVMEDLDEWYCQSCKVKQTKGAPAYLLSIDKNDRREFVRVCSNCKFISVRTKSYVFSEVIKISRQEVFTNVANLLSLPIKI